MIEIRCRAAGSGVVLELSGELSRSTARVLRSCVDAAFDAGATALDLDLAEVHVMTHQVARVIDRLAKELARRGVLIRVRNPAPAVLAVLAACGCTHLLDGDPSLPPLDRTG